MERTDLQHRLVQITGDDSWYETRVETWQLKLALEMLMQNANSAASISAA